MKCELREGFDVLARLDTEVAPLVAHNCAKDGDDGQRAGERRRPGGAQARFLGEDYWSEVMKQELLIYAYGVIAAKMTKRTYFCCPLLDGCFSCNKFPHRLPDAQTIVDEAFGQFTAVYKFNSLNEEYKPPLNKKDIKRIESTYTGRHDSNDSNV